VRSAARFDALRVSLPVGDKVWDVIVGDLGVVSALQRWARPWPARPGAIDVLINNAGVHAFSQQVTGDGLPLMVAVNYVAPFVLTRALLPKFAPEPGPASSTLPPTRTGECRR